MASLEIRKALDLNAGAYLVPLVIDGAIRDYVAKEPVLYNLLNHYPWATNTYYIRKVTALPSAVWAADGGALPAADNQTFTRVSKTVKYIYARGEVTGPMQEAAGSEFDAIALEVEAHSTALVMKLSHDLVTATGGSNDIEGILTQIGSSYAMNAINENAGGGVVDGAAGVLSANLINSAIDNSRGQVDLIVTSRRVRRGIASLLQQQQRFVDQTEVMAGFRVLTWDGIPVVTDLNWESDTDILFIKRNDARILVHKDLTYEPLAHTKDSTDFMLKMYLGFALEGRPSRLDNFTLPTGV